MRYKCHRIFLGWENQRADWDICDYVLDSDFIENNPRHKRYPIWAAWNLDKLTQPINSGFASLTSEALAGKKFCCMLVSNAKARERIDFFNELSKYKKVDSGGRYLNNIGGSVENKMDFIKGYKFVISFENSSYPGYTTEKLIEPMLVNSVPIYWGNPDVGNDFNTSSFINIKSSADYKRAIEQIIELDGDDNKYREMFAEPWFNNNQVPATMSKESLAAFLDFVIEDSKTKKPVAASWRKSVRHCVALFKNKLFVKINNRMGS